MRSNKIIPFRISILLVLIPLVLLFMSFCYVTVIGSERQNLKKAYEHRASSVAYSLASMSSNSLRLSKNYSADDTAEICHIPDVVYAMVISQSGAVKCHSDKDKIGTKLDDAITRKALSSKVECLQYAQYNGIPVIDAAVPIRDKDTYVGIARVGLSLEGQKAMLAHTSRALIGLALVLISGTLIFTAFMVYRYGNPLLVMAKVANELSRGHLESKADSSRRDEIGLIGVALNKMSANLKTVLEHEYYANKKMQERIRKLRSFADGIMRGEVDGMADIEELDEIGQLSMTINEMVRHMRGLIEEERHIRNQVENTAQLMQNSQYRELYNSMIQQPTKASVLEETIISMGAPAPKKDNAAEAQKSQAVPSDSDFEHVSTAFNQYSQANSQNNAVDSEPEEEKFDPEKLFTEENLRRNSSEYYAKAPSSAYSQVPPASFRQEPQAPRPQIVRNSGEYKVPAGLQQQPKSRLFDHSKQGPQFSDELLKSSVPTAQDVSPIERYNRLGDGQTALIATKGIQDAAPFLREVLESEGYTVVHASNTTEMLDMATIVRPQLVVLEFNETEGGNRHAINKLRSTKECAKTSVIILNAGLDSNQSFAGMNDVIEIKIPDSDEELAQMVREALAEIILIGGASPFLSNVKRKPRTLGHGRRM
ncbi:MAG: HAMP domain-containing protein [bacterium]|nr:HAMP domain-containing protein [bacterium]